MPQRRVAVIPVVRKNKRFKVCLVTSRDKRKWILPTGKHEKKLSDARVALLEAFEEAGVKGKLDKSFCKQLDVCSPSGKKKRKTKLYLIKVDKQLKKWPEKKQRQRAMVNPAKLHQYLDDKKLKKVIRASC
jgi:8-oxo-dGTP pyrophosphatase MutT (NUDIX family)